MFTEISEGKDVCDFNEDESGIDLDYDIGKLSLTSKLSEPLSMKSDKSSTSMMTSDLAGANLLLPAFESINFVEQAEQRDAGAKDTIKASSFDSIRKVDPSRERVGEGKEAIEFESSDSVHIAGPIIQKDDKSEDVVNAGSILEKNRLNECTSARKRRGHKIKLNQNDEAQKSSMDSRRTDEGNLSVDLSSLTFSRRRRSLSIKQARYPVLRYLNQNVGNQKQQRAGGDGQGNDIVDRNQAGQRSQKSTSPTVHFSLKIKIGNKLIQSCRSGNGIENIRAVGKNIPELCKGIENNLEEEVPTNVVLPCEGNSEKVILSHDALLNGHLDRKVTVKNASYSTIDDDCKIIHREEVDNMGASIDNRCSDPGTSPDSEVINSVPDALNFGKCLEDMHDSPILSKGASVSFADVSGLSLLHRNTEKGKKKDKLHKVGHCIVESKTSAEIMNNVEEFAKLGRTQKLSNGSFYGDTSINATGKALMNTSCSGGVSIHPLHCSSISELGSPCVTSNFQNSADINHSSGRRVALASSEPQICETLFPCMNGQNFPKRSRAKKGRKQMSGSLDSSSKKGNASKYKGKHNKSIGKHNSKEKGDDTCATRGVESHLTAENEALSHLEEIGCVSKSLTREMNMQILPGESKNLNVPLRNAWVRCDDCLKWRRIPATLADQIEETDCKWTCIDNKDKCFADCSIPQEKSNAEINEELEISDGSCEEDACNVVLKSNPNQSTAPQQSSWKLIKSNLFLHRNRKSQTIDEIMVCHCKPPSDGRMGCGAECFNRVLNIECVKGTCPCGKLCSNQQFQKRKYAKLESFRCGKKGYGLQVHEDISEGQFLIEYVGEVLDVHAYEARQKEYALNGHKHFYFMTLNGSEVIDACAKGNLGRFINHSCDPNCRTEKWMVNGEVCVGLFALRDIKKGEEVTFDYNYVRVFGAAVKKCVCGSLNCRGYIGGDPSSTELIVQDDSDEEYPEPVMICEDSETNNDWNDKLTSFNDRETKVGKRTPESRDRMEQLERIVHHSKNFTVNSFNDRETEVEKRTPESIDRMEQLECIVRHSENFSDTHTSETLTKNEVESIDPASADGCLKPSLATQVGEYFVKDKCEVGNCAAAVRQLANDKGNGEALNRLAPAGFKVESDETEATMCLRRSSVQPGGCSFQVDEFTNEALSAARHECPVAKRSLKCSLLSTHELEKTTDTGVPSKLVKTRRKLKSGTGGGRKERIESNLLAKPHHSSSSVKKAKIKTNAMNDTRTPDVDMSISIPHKPKNLPEFSLNSHFEAVEEKLNELLDPEGGISKRKDASRGYLKLLFLTAASGNNGHGEAIQSNRDLSMILGAILKTKSRNVLIDIINKNGLQMLHNIMKRYSREFIKTPILRKLLKVLEYLAERGILTLEHINGGPPCPGVESFKDSILILTEHADKQVHQTARNFRDRWIPRPVRKNCCTGRVAGRMEFHPCSSHTKFSVLHDRGSDQGRKLSQDVERCEMQPLPASCTGNTGVRDVSSAPCDSSGTNGTTKRMRKTRWDNPLEEKPSSRIKTDLADDGKPSINEKVPPGFPTLCNGPALPHNAYSTAVDRQARALRLQHTFGTVLGDSQQRFVSRLTVSYGVPFSIMQQFGTPEAEASSGWTVAPGVPFHPFPPLPTYSLDKRDPPTSASNSASATQSAEAEQDYGNCASYHLDVNCKRKSSTNLPDASDRYDFELGAGSYNLGRKYFKQQKLSHSKLAPPWIRNRNTWGYTGNNP